MTRQLTYTFEELAAKLEAQGREAKLMLEQHVLDMMGPIDPNYKPPKPTLLSELYKLRMAVLRLRHAVIERVHGVLNVLLHGTCKKCDYV